MFFKISIDILKLFIERVIMVKKVNIIQCMIILSLLLIVTISVPVNAQEEATGTIHGTIHKVLGNVIPPNTPFENIYVLVDPDGLQPWEWIWDCTDHNGAFEFTLPYGTHEVIIDWRQVCPNSEVIAMYRNNPGNPYYQEVILSSDNTDVELRIELEPGFLMTGIAYEAATGDFVTHPGVGWRALDVNGNVIAGHWTPSDSSGYNAYGLPYGQNIYIEVKEPWWGPWPTQIWPYLTEFWDNVHTTNSLEGDPFYVPHSEYSPNREIILNFPLDKPCDVAVASLDFLWPPEHQMVAIDINLTANDNQVIDFVITSIWQDEPTNGIGDGDTSPDAEGIGTSTAYIRAERDGSGNGRMYHIRFSSLDESWACDGEVLVGVFNNIGKRGQATDDGELYNSTLP